MTTIKIESHNHNEYPLLYYRDRDTAIKFGQILECRKCNIRISYNTGTHALPDIYALALGHRAYNYIRQSTLACVITITYNQVYIQGLHIISS